jgi:hypothetical protein
VGDIGVGDDVLIFGGLEGLEDLEGSILIRRTGSERSELARN